MSKMVNYREDMRVAGKVGYVIKSVLGTSRTPCNLQEIRTDDGEIIGDAEEIHRRITAFFKLWFSMPVECEENPLHGLGQSVGRHQVGQAEVLCGPGAHAGSDCG